MQSVSLGLVQTSVSGSNTKSASQLKASGSPCEHTKKAVQSRGFGIRPALAGHSGIQGACVVPVDNSEVSVTEPVEDGPVWVLSLSVVEIS